MKYVAALFALLLLAGCGGGGSSQPSPYQGAWAGSVTLFGSGQPQDGLPTAATLTVDSKGHATGTWSDTSGSGALAGTVTNGGTFTLNIEVPSAGQTYQAKGVTSLTQTGAWQGSLPVQDGSGMSLVLDVAKQ